MDLFVFAPGAYVQECKQHQINIASYLSQPPIFGTSQHQSTQCNVIYLKPNR